MTFSVMVLSSNVKGTYRMCNGAFHICKHTTLLFSLFHLIFLTCPLELTLMLSYLKTAPTRSTFTPRDLPIHIPEHTYDIEELDGERADVLAELIAWREQHSRYLLFGEPMSAARMSYTKCLKQYSFKNEVYWAEYHCFPGVLSQ